jgi:hypothetical protein
MPTSYPRRRRIPSRSRRITTFAGRDPDLHLRRAARPDRIVLVAHPHEPVLLHPDPPCPPPSRVPSPGYAYPQPLTRVTIVI